MLIETTRLEYNRPASVKLLEDTADPEQMARIENRPTLGGINYRYPDLAAFAVRIGRVLGRDEETSQIQQGQNAMGG